MRLFIGNIILLLALTAKSQQHSSVWISDNRNGTYKNPIIHADYSDPDAIRVGDNYYMVSSSFDAVPGIPILHSKDLVNWTLIGHALHRLVPLDHFSRTRHGEGVWAPSLRYHKKEFYLYYPDPDFGIYLLKSKNISGPWTEPILVQRGKGLIDPCPLWDDDGNVYLVHAFAGSRAGIKSLIIVKRLSPDGTRVIDDGVLVYDGHEKDPTVEGPKFYKRNGWYYIFAPAGGVSNGWQLVLRSRNIYGPYQRKIVMDQGKTTINGPHQGAWITTPFGEDWFIHFQDKDAYGRVVHLQPMKWVKDWPVIGIDGDGDGKGEPVMQYKKPVTGKNFQVQTPPDSDEFNTTRLGKQWQWQANPQAAWAFLTGTGLRLYAQLDSNRNLWTTPHLLMQKFPAESFMVTTKLVFHANTNNEQAGFTVLGVDYAGFVITNKADGNYLGFRTCRQADKNSAEKINELVKIDSSIYLRITVYPGAQCEFSYSADGNIFKMAGELFEAKPGKWIGAKLALYSSRSTQTNDAGYADFDWFRFEPVKK